MKSLWACVSLLLLAGSLQAQAPSPQRPSLLDPTPISTPLPPPDKSSQAQAQSPAPANTTLFLDVLSQRTTQLVSQLNHPDAKARADIVATLVAIEASFLDQLSSHLNDGDPEVVLRVQDTLDQAAAQARIQRVLSLPDRDARSRLLQMQKQWPDLFNRVFSNNLATRALAIDQIGRLKDPDRLAQPLLILCLGHQSEQLQSAAIRAISQGRYNSDPVVDALTDLVEEAINDGSSGNRHQYSIGGNPSTPASDALVALREFRNPRTAVRLANMLAKRSGEASYYSAGCSSSEIIDTILATADKSVVGFMMKKIKPGGANLTTFELNGMPVTSSPRDWMLAVVVKLSRQSLSDYGVIRLPAEYGYVSPYCFPSQTERQKAFDKLAQWWQENSHAYPEPPQAAAPATQPATAPAAPPDRASQNLADLLKTADIQTEMKRYVDGQVALFSQPRSTQRRQAQQTLLAFHETFLSTLARGADNSRPLQAGALRDALTQSTIAGEAASQLARLSAGQREGLLDFRRNHQSVFDDFFSSSWKRQLDAVVKLQGMADPLGSAEPLVVIAVRHPWDGVRDVALSVAATGRYRSDLLVDKLFEAAARPATGNDLVSMDYDQAVDALLKIKNPRTTPLLLGLLVSTRCMDSFSKRLDIAQSLGAGGDRRIIPALVNELGKPWAREVQMQYEKHTVTNGDACLQALLKLTAQKPKDYGMIDVPNQGPDYCGFPDAHAREKAYKQFTAWWDKNKTSPPYRDLTPLVPVEPPAPTSASGMPMMPENSGEE